MKKVILSEITYEIGDYMGGSPITSIERDGSKVNFTTETDYHTYPLKDGDFLKFEDDTYIIYKTGSND